MFIGRKRELSRLKSLQAKSVASFIALMGRRRIGKSRLLQEYAKEFDDYLFVTALPPEDKVTPQVQRDNFANALAKKYGWPTFTRDSWAELFSLAAEQTSKGRSLVVFDEISWMAKDSPLFLPQLKNAWDLEFKNNPQLVLAVCGSVSSWIDKNILSSTGFVGRISETLQIQELPLPDSLKFWNSFDAHISIQEKLRFLNVTGGIPRYLEELISGKSTEDIIRSICFQPEGFLFSEFEKLFSDLFSEKSTQFKNILKVIVDRKASHDEVASSLKLEPGGSLSLRLEELETAGFINRDFTWKLKNAGEDSRLSNYRISDNYTRFYLKYIAVNKARIKKGRFPDRGISFLPAWDSIMGLQFENLILNNRALILDLLNISPLDVLADGPFFQNRTKLQAGCQIDYLIQTKYNCLHLCEIKFRAKPLGLGIIKEVSEKLKRIRTPKNFSIRPILISGGPVSRELVEERFFAQIITASDIESL